MRNLIFLIVRRVARRASGLVLILVLTAATAFGADRTTVNMWASSLPGNYNQWVTQEFPRLVEEAFPDLRVEITVVESRQELEEKRIVAAAAGIAPDIFHDADSFVKQSAMNGTSLALDRFLDGWRDAGEIIISDAYNFRGLVYAIPYAYQVTGLAYWEDILDAAGVTPPQSWDELVAAARHLTIHSSEQGVLERGGLGTWNDSIYDGLYPLQIFVEQLGSSLYSEDLSEPRFNTPEAMQALNFARELYEAAYPTGSRPAGSFASRGTAMHFWFSTWHTTPLSDAYGPDVLQYARLAKIPGPDGPSRALGILAGWGWAISSDSPRPEAAWRIIEFFLSEEVQSRFLASFAPGGLLSPRRTLRYAPDTPFLEDAMALASPPITTWGPVHPLFGDVLRVAGPPIYRAVRGEVAVGSALEEAQRLVSSLFAEANL